MQWCRPTQIRRALVQNVKNVHCDGETKSYDQFADFSLPNLCADWAGTYNGGHVHKCLFVAVYRVAEASPIQCSYFIDK